jgi:glycosyltransferase involved in cell wall biosynthesis
MINGRDFIFFSSIEWEPLWQAHQEIASRLARAGNRVLYIENTGVRHPGLRDVSRLVTRVRRWAGTLRSGGFREVQPGLFVCSPLVLPPFGSAPERFVNRRLLVPLLARRARSLGMRDPVLWSYLPTDTAAMLIEQLRTPRSLVVYSCLADFAQLTPDRERLAAAEAHLLRSSHLVFANPSLVQHCERFSDRVHTFRSAVDLAAFVEPFADGGDLSRRIAETPQPRIGYVGGLHRHMDFGLLEAIARARPDWSWVCVGPRQEPLGRLADVPNVHLLGAVRHAELAPLIAAFDVCIVPYLESAYTRSGIPTKILEYLAMGKPVVSTPLPVAVELERQHGVVFTAPPETQTFVAALERALSLPPDGDARRAVAAERGWDRELDRIGQLLASEARAPDA